MEFIKRIGLLTTFLITLSVFGQIEIGGEKTEDSKGQEELVTSAGRKKPSDPSGNLKLTINYNQSKSYRELTPNGDLFGDSLGDRANEFGKGFASFGLGFRVDLNSFLQMDIGFGYRKNGEQYSFEQSDTNFRYITTYRYITMPIGLNYYYGDDIRVIGGAGIAPGFFTGYTQEQNWKDKKGTLGKNTIKTKSGSSDFNSTVFSWYIKAGIQLKYSERWHFYIIPEYSKQLVSSFGRFDKYIHKATAFGVNFGFAYQM